MAVLPRLTPRFQEVEGIRSLNKVDPLHPPWSSRRTVSLETVNAHDALSQRSTAMKQREFHRYHSTYETPVYGSIAAKEQYRREIRDILKDQMASKLEREKTAFSSRLTESKAFIEMDRRTIQDELQSRQKRFDMMKSFRDENKKMAAEITERKKLERCLRQREEKEMLKFNPINWSHSLR
ncbi:uncharacterized protein LOC134847638 isoform X2 [Symsagittifera roscoffensis]